MCAHFVASHRSQKRALDRPVFIGSCELAGGNHYKHGIAELFLDFNPSPLNQCLK